MYGIRSSSVMMNTLAEGSAARIALQNANELLMILINSNKVTVSVYSGWKMNDAGKK